MIARDPLPYSAERSRSALLRLFTHGGRRDSMLLRFRDTLKGSEVNEQRGTSDTGSKITLRRRRNGRNSGRQHGRTFGVPDGAYLGTTTIASTSSLHIHAVGVPDTVSSAIDTCCRQRNISLALTTG